ncbi:MAG: hypothetical protein U0414_38145 [Polyangiaceae bacterium]
MSKYFRKSTSSTQRAAHSMMKGRSAEGSVRRYRWRNPARAGQEVLLVDGLQQERDQRCSLRHLVFRYYRDAKRPGRPSAFGMRVGLAGDMAARFDACDEIRKVLVGFIY